MRSCVLLIVLAGCGPKATKPLPPERDAPAKAVPLAASSPGLPSPPAGFATCDLVTMTGGELTAWSITGGKLVKTGSTTLVKVAPADAEDIGELAMQGIGYGEWADRDHLFVTIGEGKVVMVTAQAVTLVPVPPAATFQTPKPADADGDLVEGNTELSANGLVVGEGAASWSQCAWGLPYDGFQCQVWVHAQLWPTARVTRSEAGLAARSWSWPAAPAGYAAKAQDRSVTCAHPKGKTTITAEGDESIEDVHWVSREPPRLLVSYGHPGLADVIAERWTLHEGCIVPPLATGSVAKPGPAGLWIGAGEGDSNPAVIYRGAQILGEAPDYATVWLRPTK